jgi:hypothetical protein
MVLVEIREAAAWDGLVLLSVLEEVMELLSGLIVRIMDMLERNDSTEWLASIIAEDAIIA